MVSQALLHPLEAKSVQFSYCYDRTLQCIATRYTLHGVDSDSSSSDAFTFIFASGISLSQETWIPIIKELFRHSSKGASSFKVRSAWVVERPNHGEAALINAAILKEHYSVQFLSLQYSTAIHTFLTSGFLSPLERKHLVGVGHSGGGGSLVQAVNYGVQAGHPIPLKVLFMVEAPLMGSEVWPHFDIMYKGVKKSNARRATSWPSKEAAMAWFRTRLPWKNFDPEVLRIVEDTYFIPDPVHPGSITTKTTVEQETACFVDNGTQLRAGPFLRTILGVLPTHAIEGSIHDLWPPAVYDLIAVNRREVGNQLASFTMIDDAGHYVPVVKPREVAARISQVLGASVSSKL